MIILDALSLRAVRQRLDKRKQQEEFDLHRLFLLTAYHARRRQGLQLGDDAAEVLDAEAQQLGADGLRTAVASHLSHQLYELSRALHHVLAQAKDAQPAQALVDLWRTQQCAPSAPQTPSETPTERRTGGLGFGFATSTSQSTSNAPLQHPSPSSSSLKNVSIPTHLTQTQVAEAFLSEFGFSLRVAPSSVPHKEAGDGVFIDGTASVGQIVALYPGVAYPPLYHRHIPGYPLIARTNPFLLSRFDGLVLDAKPWGKGSIGGEKWPIAETQNAGESALARLESRHPLALGHWANHPPKGTLPNVVVAAVDWDPSLVSPGSDQDLLRAYVPVVQYFPNEMILPRSHDPAQLVALVALRKLENEELFLNYRLNPNAPSGLPDWYSPVDREEDARRWA